MAGEEVGPVIDATDGVRSAAIIVERVARYGQQWASHARVRNILIAIPARLASTRLPGKVLLPDSCGVPLIARVVQTAKRYAKAMANDVRVDVAVLASADDLTELRKVDVVRSAIGIVTSADADSGLSRIAEYCRLMMLDDLRGLLVVHLQADEPELRLGHVATLVDTFAQFPSCDVATLCALSTIDDHEDRNTVKVIVGEHGVARSFSRTGKGHRHIGVYAYRAEFALWHASLSPSGSERDERLEQLRTFDRGARYRVRCVDGGPRGIDTAEDYGAFLKRDAGTERGE